MADPAKCVGGEQGNRRTQCVIASQSRLRFCSCSALVGAAQGTGARATGGRTSSRELATGLALLGRHECRQAAPKFQQSLLADPNLIEARILLGIAYDCSGEPAKIQSAFQHIWDRDLDRQEATAETALIAGALKTGLPVKTSHGKYFEALLYYRLGSYDSALAALQASSVPVADSWAYYNRWHTFFDSQGSLRRSGPWKTLSPARLIMPIRSISSALCCLPAVMSRGPLHG